MAKGKRKPLNPDIVKEILKLQDKWYPDISPKIELTRIFEDSRKKQNNPKG